MRKNSVKMTRINQEIVRTMADILRNDLKDPRVGMLTSVTGADAGTDLKTCKVYISAYGDENERAEAMAALRRAEGFIKRKLAEKLNLRNTPALTFIEDTSISYGMHIESILQTIDLGEEDGSADQDI